MVVDKEQAGSTENFRMRATGMGCLSWGKIERGLARQLKMAIRLPPPPPLLNLFTYLYLLLPAFVSKKILFLHDIRMDVWQGFSFPPDGAEERHVQTVKICRLQRRQLAIEKLVECLANSCARIRDIGRVRNREVGILARVQAEKLHREL